MNISFFRIGSLLTGAVALLSGMNHPVTSYAAPPAPGTYHEVARYPLGGDGFWDYLTCDSAGKRVFITRGSHVQVINSENGSLLGDIQGVKGCHGVALAPEFKTGYISSGGDDSVVTFDMKTLKVTGTIPVGKRPDAILYEPFTKRIFTFNAGTQDTTAIDAATGKVIGSIPLGGKPEFAQSDGKGKVFVNIEDKSEIIAFDPKTLTVLSHMPLAPGEEPTGLALDGKNHRLFASCGNKLAAVVDVNNGKLIATPTIGEGSDAAAFDPGTGYAFTSNGQAGTLSVITPNVHNTFDVTTIKTLKGARTMTLDPATHKIYLATANFMPPAAGERRPGMVPGSFVIVVYAP
jgi:YVTN family beta-propeller protein